MIFAGRIGRLLSEQGGAAGEPSEIRPLSPHEIVVGRTFNLCEIYAERRPSSGGAARCRGQPFDSTQGLNSTFLVLTLVPTQKRDGALDFRHTAGSSGRLLLEGSTSSWSSDMAGLKRSTGTLSLL
ncbi:hypothetical protein GRJ2_003203500 [Grus japonensis]|uniref:Uncharacterized protein n=1 Tax=Grus japonensis TaxID=30415 RepID=A0ABC9VTF2_GRUJA